MQALLRAANTDTYLWDLSKDPEAHEKFSRERNLEQWHGFLDQIDREVQSDRGAITFVPLFGLFRPFLQARLLASYTKLLSQIRRYLIVGNQDYFQDNKVNTFYQSQLNEVSDSAIDAAERRMSDVIDIVISGKSSIKTSCRSALEAKLAAIYFNAIPSPALLRLQLRELLILMSKLEQAPITRRQIASVVAPQLQNSLPAREPPRLSSNPPTLADKLTQSETIQLTPHVTTSNKLNARRNWVTAMAGTSLFLVGVAALVFAPKRQVVLTLPTNSDSHLNSDTSHPPVEQSVYDAGQHVQNSQVISTITLHGIAAPAHEGGTSVVSPSISTLLSNSRAYLAPCFSGAVPTQAQVNTLIRAVTTNGNVKTFLRVAAGSADHKFTLELNNHCQVNGIRLGW